MGVCVTLVRIVCVLVGVSLSALYVTGYTHGRPILTPQTNNGRPTRDPTASARAAEPTTPADASARATCSVAGECASPPPEGAQAAPPLAPSAADGEASSRAAPGGDDTVCRWWMPEVGRETDTLCSAFALRRLMGSDALAQALERAKRCAILHGTACVLSHEVELQVPAVMLWDIATSAMRMYLLPRVVPVAEGKLYDERRVAVVRPPFDDDVARSRTPLVVSMNRSVEVDHVSTTSHARESEQLLDDDAYCMQMLKLTIPDQCNEEL